jgi:hypothetical protein
VLSSTSKEEGNYTVNTSWIVKLSQVTGQLGSEDVSLK